MSRRALDDGIVRNKLDAIERARTTLRDIDPLTAERMRSDGIIAAAVERLMCRMVELAIDTNTHISTAVLARAAGDYRESFDAARDAGALTRELAEALKPSVGMRNAIVHGYLDTDYEIVANAVPLAVRAYGDYVTHVAGFVRDRAQ